MIVLSVQVDEHRAFPTVTAEDLRALADAVERGTVEVIRHEGMLAVLPIARKR